MVSFVNCFLWIAIVLADPRNRDKRISARGQNVALCYGIKVRAASGPRLPRLFIEEAGEIITQARGDVWVEFVVPVPEPRQQIRQAGQQGRQPFELQPSFVRSRCKTLILLIFI